MNIIRDAFVVMPFSKTESSTESEWTEIYENIFKPTFEENGYSCERSQPMTGSLAESIIDRLYRARIVLVDITDMNPNVLYELGIRHSLSKRTIIVTRDSEQMPSDLSGYWFINYGLNPGAVTKFKREIGRILDQIEEDPEKPDNPVSSYLEKQNFSVLSVFQKQNAKRLDALHTELSGNLVALKYIESGHKKIILTLDCIGKLLHDRYIDPGPNVLKGLYELFQIYQRINSGLSEQDVLEKVINETKQWMEVIIKIRDSLISGKFSEPTAISRMVWGVYPSGKSRHCYWDSE